MTIRSGQRGGSAVLAAALLWVLGAAGCRSGKPATQVASGASAPPAATAAAPPSPAAETPGPALPANAPAGQPTGPGQPAPAANPPGSQPARVGQPPAPANAWAAYGAVATAQFRDLAGLVRRAKPGRTLVLVSLQVPAARPGLIKGTYLVRADGQSYPYKGVSVALAGVPGQGFLYGGPALPAGTVLEIVYKGTVKARTKVLKQVDACAADILQEMPTAPSAIAAPAPPPPAEKPKPTLAFRQVRKQPRRILVKTPWRDHPQSTLHVTFLHLGANKPAEKVFGNLQGAELSHVARLTRDLATGYGRIASPWRAHEVIATEKGQGRVPTYAVGWARNEKRAVFGAHAVFFHLSDWARPDGLLDIPLDSRYFGLEGGMCVWLVSRDGEHLAKASQYVVLR